MVFFVYSVSVFMKYPLQFLVEASVCTVAGMVLARGLLLTCLKRDSVAAAMLIRWPWHGPVSLSSIFEGSSEVDSAACGTHWPLHGHGHRPPVGLGDASVQLYDCTTEFSRLVGFSRMPCPCRRLMRSTVARDAAIGVLNLW